MKQKRNFRSRLKLWAVVAIAAAAVAVTCSVRHIAGNSSVRIAANKHIDITPEQIQSIRNIGEWEFLSVSDEELIDTVGHGLFSAPQLSRIYYGTLRLGINLHEARPGWIKTAGDTVTVMLPPVKLLDEDFIDEARTRSFFESGSWTAADREALYHRAYTNMKAHCLTPQNITSAENNGDAQFRQLLRSMGFRHIVVRFEKQQTQKTR